jgi:hypothetical protein
MFLDLPWEVVRALVVYAVECHTADSILARTNATCRAMGVAELADLTLPASVDSLNLRVILGATAKEKAWFKTIDHGEYIATLIYPCLDKIAAKPLAQYLERVRAWVDG